MGATPIGVCPPFALFTYGRHIIFEVAEVNACLWYHLDIACALVCANIFLFKGASVKGVNDIGYHLTVSAAVTLIDDGKELTALCPPACAVFLASKVNIIA